MLCMTELEVGHTTYDGLPAVWIEPTTPSKPRVLALWLTHLGGSKEQTIPILQELADMGCVAVSFDPWRHGERGSEEPGELLSRVLGDFRQQMWPILGQTTLDCLRVIDWALDSVAPDAQVVVGGVSMGGDISVALAGIDSRVTRVAALIATPDWTRPGMRDLADPAVVIDQGTAGAYAQWFYDHLDPLTHLDRFRHGPAITFECGAADAHVPPDGAVRFREALRTRHPAAADNVRITMHPGAAHFDAKNDSDFVRNALRWLTEASGGPGPGG